MSSQTWRTHSGSGRAACSSTGWPHLVIAQHCGHRVHAAAQRLAQHQQVRPHLHNVLVAKQSATASSAASRLQRSILMQGKCMSCPGDSRYCLKWCCSAPAAPLAASRAVRQCSVLTAVWHVERRQRTGSWSHASILPVRAHPVCTSSAMSSARCRCSSSCACFRYPGSGTTTPASPCMQQRCPSH